MHHYEYHGHIEIRVNKWKAWQIWNEAVPAASWRLRTLSHLWKFTNPAKWWEHFIDLRSPLVKWLIKLMVLVDITYLFQVHVFWVHDITWAGGNVLTWFNHFYVYCGCLGPQVSHNSNDLATQIDLIVPLDTMVLLDLIYSLDVINFWVLVWIRGLDGNAYWSWHDKSVSMFKVQCSQRQLETA